MNGTSLKCMSGRLHGQLLDGRWLEISCRSRSCGKEPGVVVIHRFDIRSGECVSTNRYKQATITKGVEDGTGIEGIAVRSA